METTLVISTLRGCGACEYYKSTQHEKLLQLLHHDSPSTKIIIITYTSFDNPVDDLPSNINPKVREYATWYPSFALFPSKELEMTSEGATLDGVVMGGTVKHHEHGLDIVRGEVSYDPILVHKWLMEQLQRPPFDGLVHHQQFAVKIRRRSQQKMTLNTNIK